VESGIRLLEQIVARCESIFRLAPLSMIAWLNWAIGQSSIAHVYLREAREIDPEYGMAEVLDNMLSNGMFPEWAFEE
jgi:chorismate mutase